MIPVATAAVAERGLSCEDRTAAVIFQHGSVINRAGGSQQHDQPAVPHDLLFQPQIETVPKVGEFLLTAALTVKALQQLRAEGVVEMDPGIEHEPLAVALLELLTVAAL